MSIVVALTQLVSIAVFVAGYLFLLWVLLLAILMLLRRPAAAPRDATVVTTR